MSDLQIAARLVRLGGEYERADQARDYARKVEIDRTIQQTARGAGEDSAWWLAVIRGRNVIRRARGLEEVHV